MVVMSTRLHVVGEHVAVVLSTNWPREMVTEGPDPMVVEMLFVVVDDETAVDDEMDVDCVVAPRTVVVALGSALVLPLSPVA